MSHYDDVPLEHQLTYTKPRFDAAGQPRWDVPEVVAIEAAVSGDHYQDPVRDRGPEHARDRAREEALAALGGGATAVHLSAYDGQGRRSGRLEDYAHLVDACRERFGHRFVANCNALFGHSFEDKLAAVIGGLAEEAVINCHERYHPRFLQASAEVMEAHGCRPHLTVRDTIEIAQARDILIGPGFVRRPYSWLIYPSFDGIPMPHTRGMYAALEFMVDRIREVDADSVIMVGCTGRAGTFLCATAMMMGLNVRVGLEESMWLYPHLDQRASNNLEGVERAVELARMLGRRPATGDEYRRMIGLPEREGPAAAGA